MTSRFLRQNRLTTVSVTLRVANNYEARIEAVRAGLGVAILPRFVVKRELWNGTLCALNARKSAFSSSTITLIQRTHQILSPSVAAVRSTLERSLSTNELPYASVKRIGKKPPHLSPIL
jgi:DNA-binding transcriptional LysR family regulator